MSDTVKASVQLNLIVGHKGPAVLPRETLLLETNDDEGDFPREYVGRIDVKQDGWQALVMVYVDQIGPRLYRRAQAITNTEGVSVLDIQLDISDWILQESD